MEEDVGVFGEAVPEEFAGSGCRAFPGFFCDSGGGGGDGDGGIGGGADVLLADEGGWVEGAGFGGEDDVVGQTVVGVAGFDYCGEDGFEFAGVGILACEC